MMPTLSERQELAKRFADHVARMQRCLQGVDKRVEQDDIVYAWADYSNGLCASWLVPPEEDDALLEILLKHLPPSGMRWYTRILNAEDGSGDGILELPDELMTEVGWKEGDTLTITRTDSDELILRRKP